MIEDRDDESNADDDYSFMMMPDVMSRGIGLKRVRGFCWVVLRILFYIIFIFPFFSFFNHFILRSFVLLQHYPYLNPTIYTSPLIFVNLSPIRGIGVVLIFRILEREKH